MSEKNPCAVILAEGTSPFDVEDYRADLTRRRETLMSMGDQYYEKFSASKRDHDRDDWRRCVEKAKGIEIALSLLPRETP